VRLERKEKVERKLEDGLVLEFGWSLEEWLAWVVGQRIRLRWLVFYA
jgi:hypothetical protein